MDHKSSLKRCFREPIQEIFDAARYLDAAVSAHLAAYRQIAEKLFSLSNDPKIRTWTNSIWGKNSLYFTVIKQIDLPLLPRVGTRKPISAQILELHRRDSHHCRYCGLTVTAVFSQIGGDKALQK